MLIKTEKRIVYFTLTEYDEKTNTRSCDFAADVFLGTAGFDKSIDTDYGTAVVLTESDLSDMVAWVLENLPNADANIEEVAYI